MYLIQPQEVGHAEQEKHVGGSEAGQERVVVVAGGREGAVPLLGHLPPCKTSWSLRPISSVSKSVKLYLTP